MLKLVKSVNYQEDDGHEEVTLPLKSTHHSRDTNWLVWPEPRASFSRTAECVNGFAKPDSINLPAGDSFSSSLDK